MGAIYPARSSIGQLSCWARQALLLERDKYIYPRTVVQPRLFDGAFTRRSRFPPLAGPRFSDQIQEERCASLYLCERAKRNRL